LKKGDGKISSSQDITFVIATQKSSDSLQTDLTPLARRLTRKTVGDRNAFIIRIKPDTISRDSIQRSFQKLLNKENISLPFFIKHDADFHPRFPIDPARAAREAVEQEEPSQANPFENYLGTDWVPFDPLNRYAAQFYEIPSFLFRQILPQVGFSVLLLLLTSLAFAVLYKSLREQQRLMTLKNEFISNMTHELKTPISTVSVALEAIQNFNGANNPALTAEYIEIARHELNRLTLLTDKVLRTSVYEEKGIAFDSEPVDLSKVVNQVLFSLKLVFEKQHATVAYKQEGQAFTVRGSEIHLTNLVFNLLDNALKYSSSNPVINIKLTAHATKIYLTISDEGIGIPREYQSKIFEKFFRVPTENIHNVKGYGLGSNYVQSVVKSHGGKIVVSSEPGKGSTFVVTLPN